MPAFANNSIIDNYTIRSTIVTAADNYISLSPSNFQFTTVLVNALPIGNIIFDQYKGPETERTTWS